jgi:hypothetical protein
MKITNAELIKMLQRFPHEAQVTFHIPVAGDCENVVAIDGAFLDKERNFVVLT